MPTRNAHATWSGALASGSGTIQLPSADWESQYSYASRFEEGTGTNPEELLAAAHAGCYSMAVSHELAQAGHPPTSAHTVAKVHLKQIEGGFEIPRIDLVLTAEVPGIDDAEFQTIAERAKENCPLSKVLAAAEITLEASLTN